MAGGGEQRIGLIGAGRMATAIARGLIGAKFAAAQRIQASDPSEECRRQFAAATGAPAVEDNLSVVAESDVVVLAVKPQHMGEVLANIQGSLTHRPLVVSIAAGVPLSRMTDALGSDQRVIRVMPNTPCLVQAGATAFARGGAATAADAEYVRGMFSTVGMAIEVAESLLDAVTGLSGSGPAYGFQVIEALSDGGVAAGLPRGVATQLAAQTMLGAARMVLETGEHPGVLKDAVASPGGTTIAGLLELERGGLRGLLMDAVRAAALRSEELGKKAVTS